MRRGKKVGKYFIGIFLHLVKRKRLLGWLFCVLLLVFLFFWTDPAINTSGTIKVWDRNGTLLYESAGEIGSKRAVSYKEMPEYLINAVVASEDETFWTNQGVDFRAILRATNDNIKAGKIVSGASTITQQLARSTTISPNQLSSRSFIRKIREILIAVRLSAAYSKEEILEMYMNEMYFGNLSYGIGAAAATYFGKDASELSLSESAFLVGLLSNPYFEDFSQAKKRQEQVLDRMVENKYITLDKAREAKGEIITIALRPSSIKAPHFVHFVLEKMQKLGIDTKKGINIYTTLDYPTFELSERIAKMWIEKLSAEHDLSNAALVLIKNDTGEILSMLGGIDYFDVRHSGQVNMATALRQPGSALKPITYAASFIQGYTPATLIYDVKKVYKTKKGEGFTPNNYDGAYHGLVLAREALASSLNLPAVEMLDRVGIGSFLKLSKDMGITTFNEEDRYDLSLTLGGGEVKLTELANAYATFARGGTYKETFAIEKIEDEKGNVVYQHKVQDGRQVLGPDSKQISYLISDILSDSKARIGGFGEKNALVLSRPAAVKTGTTTDWHDNWTVGYTPSYTVGVWVGNNDNHPMRQITGVVGAAPIWNQFFEEFLKGKPKEKFARPERIKEVEVCKLSGEKYDGVCPERLSEIFVEGTEPNEFSTMHKKLKIDTRNGFLAGEDCPVGVVVEKIFVDYPPEVYTWAAERNMEVIPSEYSPLCGNSRQAGNSQAYLVISYPREKAVFEYAPTLVDNQAIVFEVQTSSNIKSVSWYVDGKIIEESDDFPFKVSWPPIIGKHKIKAVGETSDGKKITAEEVNITVVGYKEGY